MYRIQDRRRVARAMLGEYLAVQVGAEGSGFKSKCSPRDGSVKAIASSIRPI